MSAVLELLASLGVAFLFFIVLEPEKYSSLNNNNTIIIPG